MSVRPGLAKGADGDLASHDSPTAAINLPPLRTRSVILNHSLANQWSGAAGRPHSDTSLVSDRQRALVLLVLFLVSTILIVTSLHYSHPSQPHPGAVLSQDDVRNNPHYLRHLDQFMAHATSTQPKASATASPYSVIYVTVPTKEVGEQIAHALLEKQLAACCNLMPAMTSIYKWEGKVHTEPEHLMMVKTRSGLFPEVCAVVRAHHPYQVPECIELPIQQGSKEYLAWIGENAKDIGE